MIHDYSSLREKIPLKYMWLYLASYLTYIGYYMFIFILHRYLFFLVFTFLKLEFLGNPPRGWRLSRAAEAYDHFWLGIFPDRKKSGEWNLEELAAP